MAINDFVQYTSVLFSPLHFSVYPKAPILVVWFDSTIIDIISTILVTMYYSWYVGL